MIRLKAGVKIAGLQPEMLLALQVADSIYAKRALDCVVTSGKDGTHSRGSLHYVGLALDIRTNTLEPGAEELVRTELADALGPEFDVVLEAVSTRNEHLHVEFQPKEG